MFKNIKFILHKPQLSENIGACARAMKNFNIRKLYIVDPKPNFPNDKIIATSVGANDLIKNTKTYKTLEEAIQNSDYVVSTTARFRNKNLKHITINDLNKIDFKKKLHLFLDQRHLGYLIKKYLFQILYCKFPLIQNLNH